MNRMRSSPLAVGPVGDAAARQLTRGVRGARTFAQAVDPDLLAGLRIERDDRTARAGGGIDDTLDHQRRALKLELGTRSEVVGLEPPRHLELVEVRALIWSSGDIPGASRASAA